MKSKFYLISLLITFAHLSFSQETLREIHGSIVIRQSLFNYTYVHNPTGSHTFLMLPIGNRTDILGSVGQKLSSWGKFRLNPKTKEFILKIDSVQRDLSRLNLSIENVKTTFDTSDIKSSGFSFKKLIADVKKERDTLSAISQVISQETLKLISEKKLAEYSLFDTTRSRLVREAVKQIFDQKLSDSIFSKDHPLRSQIVLSIKSLTDSLGKELTSYETLLDESKDFLKVLELYNPDNINSEPTRLQDFTLKIFSAVFQDQLYKNNPDLLFDLLSDQKKPGSMSAELDEIISEVFYTIKARINFVDEEPIAAVVMLSRGVIPVFSAGTSKSSKNPSLKAGKSDLVDMLDLGKVSIEFESGTIKNIEILLKPNANTLSGRYPTPIRFRNNAPIGILTKFHPDKIKRHRIFNSDSLFVNLSDVISYYPSLRTDSENYAPANSVVDLSVDAAKLFVELKKEKTSLIADVRIYSDLKGLEEGQPNGLIQTEISRKIDLNSNHKQRSNHINNSFFRFIEPKLTISKIDQKDRSLELPANEVFLGLTRSYNFRINSVQLNKYQYIKLGADLCIYKINITPVNFQVLGNVTWIGTNVSDYIKDNLQVSELQKRQIYSITGGPGMLLEVKPDSRWGGYVRADWFLYNDILTSDYILNNKRLPKTFTFEMYLKTNTTSKFYFRYANSWTEKKINFYQMQIGYQASLFGISGNK